MAGMVIVPILFVFMSPFLTASQPVEVHLEKKGLLQEIRSVQQTKEKRAERASPERSRQLLDHPPVIDQSGKDIHLLLDTSRHRLFVKQGERVVYTAIASTGKGSLLIDPRNPDRVWTFKTPKGRFTIQSKLKDPVWVRPDWAFIERGDPVPQTYAERLMPGVLGSYALGFGDGYFIHGALYLNLLGQDVTHGCIQLNPQDLQFVYETIPLGTPLVII